MRQRRQSVSRRVGPALWSRTNDARRTATRPLIGRSDRTLCGRSGRSRSLLECSPARLRFEVPQPPTKLSLEPPLRRLYGRELRVVGGFEVVVLGFIPSAVRVHESPQLVTERRTARYSIGPAGLGRVAGHGTSLAHRAGVGGVPPVDRPSPDASAHRHERSPHESASNRA